MAQEVTSSNFDTLVLKSDKPVLVDFWAEWCGPCKQIGPVIEELSNDYQGRAVIGKLNIDKHPEVAGRFGITSIPTLVVFKDGKPVEAQVGAAPKSTISRMIEKHL